MVEFGDFATAAAASAFALATWYGIATLRHGAGWLKPAVTYVTSVAALNFAFRMILLGYRLSDAAIPQPLTTNVALILQVTLGAALLLIAAVTRMQSKAGQYDA